MATSYNKKKRKKRARALAEQVKPCRFTKEGVYEIDYRDIDVLRRYVSQQGKIQPGSKNNVSSYYQRQLRTAIKRARFLALLPTVGD